MACTLAPATTPLCAMGVAIEIPLAQLWPGPPGILDGIAQRYGRHIPRDVADIVRSAARRSRTHAFAAIVIRPRPAAAAFPHRRNFASAIR